MNILQRRMFQEGGEATPEFTLVDPGRSITREEMTGFGAGIGGGRDPLAATLMSAKKTELMDIVADETGQLYGKEGDRLIPIDMAMGRTPREALLNMEKEIGIDSLRNNAMLAATLFPAGRFLAKGASKVGGFFYKPSAADFTVTPGGVASAVTIGDKITGPGKTALLGLGAGSLYLGAESLKDAAITTPDEIAADLEKIESSKPKESSTEVAAKITDDKIVEVKNSEVITEDPTEEKSETDVLVESEAEEPKTFQTTIFQNPNFVRLIRNISAGLATSDSMAEGLAKGAAAAAAERAAEEQAFAEREFEMEKLEAKAEDDLQKELLKKQLDMGKDFRVKQAEYETDLSNAAFEYDTSDAVIGAIKEARRYVQTGNVTGLTPLIGEYIRKAKAFVGAGGKKLTDREIAKNLINDIINGNIKELTGESGRTISNLDRQVAANLIGAIDWKADQATVLQKLELAEERARKKKENSYKNYLAARKPFENAGYKVPSRFDILSQQIQPEGERVRLQLR
jgi:hypothetical protein